MQWTVQVFVILLNIVWIIFFLQPDPLSVFVQRRSSDSSDEEMHFGEFCIGPQSDMKWTQTEHSVNITSNKTNNTTAEVDSENNFPLNEVHSINTTNVEQDCHCNYTNMRKTDLKSSDLFIQRRPPAPGCEPKIIMMFPNKEVCMDEEVFFSAFAPLTSDVDETTPARPPVQRPTSSEVTTASGLISSSRSEAAGVGVTHQSKPPVREKDNKGRKKQGFLLVCCKKVSRIRVPVETIKGYMIQFPRSGCPTHAIIVFTNEGKSLCINPRAPWIRRYLKTVD